MRSTHWLLLGVVVSLRVVGGWLVLITRSSWHDLLSLSGGQCVMGFNGC